MPLATGAGQSGSAAAGRSAAVARSGSASSSSSTTNRSRPVPLRRATPSASTSSSTSSLANRSKVSSSQTNVGQSISTSAAPASILSSIPKPSFPPSDAFEVQIAERKLLPARLLQLARLYIKGKLDISDEVSSCDLQSACFYAYLALQIEPSSLPARRILATTLLHGAQPFPFGPGSVHSANADLHNFNSSSPSSASISGAHAAIEILKEGNEEVFLDVGCARIFARASTILGKVKEGKEALAWTLKRCADLKRSRKPSSSSETLDVVSTMPRFNHENVEEAFAHCEIGALAARGNRYDEAKAYYLKGKKLDRWSWSCWTGLCDVGSEESVASSFCGDLHHPKSFYADQLEIGMLSHGYDTETVRKTIEELKSRGDEYFQGDEGKRKEDVSTISTQRLGPPGEMASTLRKTNGNGNASATSTASALSKNFSRPGSRLESTGTATAGTKRVRTTTSGSTTSTGAAPRLAPGASQNGTAQAKSTTDGHVSKRPAVSSITRASAPQIASKARSGGTLSAMRTNEQQRPLPSVDGIKSS